MGLQGQTVAEYFNGATDGDALIYRLTNTHITPDEKYSHWLSLVIRAKDVVEKWGTRSGQLEDARQHDGTVIDQLSRDGKPLPPRSWIAVITKLRAGEPLLEAPPTVEPTVIVKIASQAEMAAWTAFNDENYAKYPILSERRAAFDKEWKP